MGTLPEQQARCSSIPCLTLNSEQEGAQPAGTVAAASGLRFDCQLFILLELETISFQNSVDAAKPLLRKAIQISQQTPYWHCRLLFQLAVSTGVSETLGHGLKYQAFLGGLQAAIEGPAIPLSQPLLLFYILFAPLSGGT